MLYDSVGPTGNQLNAELAFCGTMDLVAIEQEVTDYLVHALELSDRPPAAMAYCRLATECITHNLHYREHGEYPSLGGKGKFPSLAAIISRVVDSLERQTGEVLYSINAQSRGSLHWDFENRGGAVQGHHVEAVITQISNTFTDVFDISLSLSGITVSDEEVERKAKETLDWRLTQQGVDESSSPNEDEVEEGELDDVLGLAEAVRGRGYHFSPWDSIRLGKAADIRARTSQADVYYREALNQFIENGDRKGEAASLNGLGNVAKQRGDFDEAERLYRSSLSLERENGNPVGEATSLKDLGNIAMRRGDLDEAERLYRQSLDIHLENGNARGEAASLNNLGIIARRRGDLDEAEMLYRQSLAIEREIGGPLYAASTLNNLGSLAKRRGDLVEAEMLYREALSLYNEDGHFQGELMSLEHLGNIAKQRGDFDEAERLYRIVLSQSIENRDRRRESQLLNKLGRIARKRGDFEKAERLHTEALNIDRQQDNRQGESQELARLGRIALDRGDHNAAEKLYRDSVRIVKELGSPFDQWFIDNGYTEPDAEWNFPPPRENSE